MIKPWCSTCIYRNELFLRCYFVTFPCLLPSLLFLQLLLHLIFFWRSLCLHSPYLSYFKFYFINFNYNPSSFLLLNFNSLLILILALDLPVLIFSLISTLVLDFNVSFVFSRPWVHKLFGLFPPSTTPFFVLPHPSLRCVVARRRPGLFCVLTGNTTRTLSLVKSIVCNCFAFVSNPLK